MSMKEKGTAIYRYEQADYLNVGTATTPEFALMNVFDSLDESPGAVTSEKHYTSDKNKTTETTGYATKFALTGDQYRDNKVSEFLRDIGEEQKLGVTTDFVRVRLYQPIENKEDTYYARKFTVSPEIATLGGAGGEKSTIEGSLNTIGDLVIGEFNTVTKTFTAASTAAVQAMGG